MLFNHERHTQREAETQAEGEVGALCGVPNAGLEPRTPGSGFWPEPKADVQPLSHPRVSGLGFEHVNFRATQTFHPWHMVGLEKHWPRIEAEDNFADYRLIAK